MNKIDQSINFKLLTTNFKENFKAILVSLMVCTTSVFIIIFIAENKIISESAAVAMSNASVLGFVGVLFKYLGKRKEP